MEYITNAVCIFIQELDFLQCHNAEKKFGRNSVNERKHLLSYAFLFLMLFLFVIYINPIEIYYNFFIIIIVCIRIIQQSV